MADLKQRIEKIIEEEREAAAGTVGDAAVAVQHCRWRLGLEILKDYPRLENPSRGGRGVYSGYSQIQREIGRTRKTVSKWISLVAAVGKTKKDWEMFAEKERVRAIAAWLKGMAPKELPAPPEGSSAINGVSLFTGDVLAGLENLPAESVDLACIDPPYNVGKDDWDRFATDDEYFDWCQQWLAAVDGVMKKTSSLYLFGVFPMLRAISGLIDGLGWTYRSYIIWDTVQGTGGGLWVNRHEDVLFYTRGEKPYADLEAVKVDREAKDVREYGGGLYDKKNMSNVWYVPCVDEKDKERTVHPTQKPVELYRRMIAGSCPPGGLILDPFLGSGSAAVATVRTVPKRNFYGIEKNKDYMKLVEARLYAEKTTG